jgi:cysteine synthase A
LFASIDFPWETVVDEVQEVDSPQSYRMSMLLSREGLICGPSSGMALQALLNVLQKAKDEGRLAELAAADGQVRAVFPCCDLPYQYMDNYALKLGPSAFEPIADVVSGFQVPGRAALYFILFGYGLLLGLTLGNVASPRHRHPPV